MSTPTTGLQFFARAKRVRLSTYEREGTPVGYRAHIAVEGDRAYVRTYGRARSNLARYPEVEITTATPGGTPSSAPMKARVRELTGGDSRHAATALARKHPLMEGLVTPLKAALRFGSSGVYEIRLIGE